ncbi:MAG TPA: amidohydrolase [Planctomycetaceae bacterium]|nr:amidohydrolase [Planctomycetaceae bacterium]
MTRSFRCISRDLPSKTNHYSTDEHESMAMGLRPFNFCGLILLLVCCSNYLKADDRVSKEKKELCGIVNARLAEDWDAALQIWNFAEPGYQETKSSALLASMLERAGFKITKQVAGIPTAFTAEFSLGENPPIIGILGEFDALPGLSQEAVPYRKVSEGKTYGHACGHHLFGVASASAAVSLSEYMTKHQLAGTIRFYGCPAEEGGSAKAFMVREGLFDDCGAVLHWHPSSMNAAGDRLSLARIAVKFRFLGKAAHAAGAPEQGRSALDAVELTNHAAQLLREHTPDGTRIHHIITAGGDAPNIVPRFAEVYYYVRHPESQVVKDLYRRLELCAQAGALATETILKIDYQGGIMEIFPNNTLASITMNNLKALNDLTYSEEELKFAIKLQEELPQPEPLDSISQVVDKSGTVGKGSTDVGDVSWVVPTTGFSTACWVPGTPGHSWQAVACGGTTIARNGMNLATRVLATSAYDLLVDPDVIEQAQQEQAERLKDRKYETLLKQDQKPPLDYRNPPEQD